MKNIKLKNWIKRILLLTLAFILSFTLIACNKKPEDKFVAPTPIKTIEPVEYDYLQPITNTIDDQWESDLPLVDIYDEEDETKNKAFYIVTSPGEDASTMININYHTRSAQTNVEYTLRSDEDFADKKIAPQRAYVFSDDTATLKAPFEPRNICRADITGLKPNTEYHYRINNGDGTYSSTYNFITAGTEETSFLFMTDAHYYSGDTGAHINEKLIEKAVEIQPNINLLLTTGDWIDRAGDPGDWEVLFRRAESMQNFSFLGVPGNHEYYSAEHSGNKIFSAHFNFPHNGVKGSKGASYYVIYNNILFIQIDNQNKANFTAQMQWIERTIYNNPTKFVILGLHTPINIKNTHNDYSRPFLDIVEKHSIDLVLSGHYHSHNFKTDIYNDEVQTDIDEYLGVTYLNGFSSGIKGSPSVEQQNEYARGYIIDTDGDTLQIRYIDVNGRIRGTYTVENKKNAEVVEASNQELYDSITQSFDEENRILTFNWSRKFYGNVDRVKVQSNYRDKESTYVFFPTPAYSFHHIRNINLDYDYSYTLTIYFKDGTTMDKTFELQSEVENIFNREVVDISTKSVKFTYELNDKFTYIVDDYEVYLNGELRAVYRALDKDFKQVLYVDLAYLEPGTTYDLVIKTYAKNEYLFHATAQFTTLKTNASTK